MNTMRTFLLFAALFFLFIWIGNLVAGQQGMIIAFIFAGIMNFFAYWFSDKIVLKLYHARELKEEDAPELFALVHRLSLSAGIPNPRIYLIGSRSPNAFATGRNPDNAALAVTKGLLDLLNSEELAGVIGHELAHIRNRDVLTATIAATIAGAIFMLARMAQWAAIFGYGGRSREERGGILGMLIVAIVAPLAALLVQMAISRSREFAADASSAQITQNPRGLANALRKLTAGAKQQPLPANPTTAHLFIVNPLSGRSLMSLFSTHPLLEERIRRLESIKV